MKEKRIFVEIKRELEQLEISLRDVLDSEQQLVSDISFHLLSSAGKRLRPALFFLCAKLKSKNLEKFIPVAVAIELIHSATLVHDDVVDNSNFRRGLPSVNSKWGNQVSVLMGDYLFAKAFAILTKFNSISLINVMSNVVEQMSEGEIQQLYETYTSDVSEEVYLERLRKKTALFISSSCQSGGIVTGASEFEINALISYGYNIGMAFQITDDLLDFLGDETKTGKPVGNDLKHGTITLPVIYMLNESPKGDYFRNKIRERQVDQGLIIEIIREINNIGALNQTYNLAEDYIKRAVLDLEVFPESIYKKNLEFIAQFILKRYY